jgi:hypothetical protein
MIVQPSLAPVTQSPTSSSPAAPPLPTTYTPQIAEVVPAGPSVIPLHWNQPTSTQNVVATSTAPPPSYSSVIASGQPASAAVSTTRSWFTDPAQEVIGGVPNWGLAAGLLALMVMMKGKR